MAFAVASMSAQHRADRQQLTDPSSSTMILLGDPQAYVKYDLNQPLLDLQMAWVYDNIGQLNMKAVLCVGDLVEQNDNNALTRKMLNQTGFIGTDRLYTAALVNGKPEVFVNPGGRKSRAEVQMMRDEKQGKTIYRFAIPWSELNTSPRPGNVIGFALLIADSDWEKRQFQYRLELGRGIDGAFHDPGRLLSLIIE